MFFERPISRDADTPHLNPLPQGERKEELDLRGCYEGEWRVICEGDKGMKNMCFCETNRIGICANSGVSNGASIGYNFETRFLNPVRLEPFRSLAGYVS